MTLFISDLDGTLMGGSCAITDKSLEILKNEQEEGLVFSVATARSAATALPITEPINLKIPLVLMNGAVLFDPLTHKYPLVNLINKKSCDMIISACEKAGVSGFMFAEENGVMNVYHDKLKTVHEQVYYSKRNGLPLKNFVEISDFYKHTDERVAYFSFTGDEAPLKKLHSLLCNIEGINYTMYEDKYVKTFFLEIFSENASKAKTTKELMRIIGADKVVAFGDNYNDMPLFEVADTAVAVSNAVPEILEIADFITPNDDFNGVANFIVENWKKL